MIPAPNGTGRPAPGPDAQPVRAWTEATPNPAALKFIPGGAVSPVPVAYRREDAAAHPFLSELFAAPEVYGVLLGSDFVTVSLSSPGGWPSAPAGILHRAAATVKRHAGAYPAPSSAVACQDIASGRGGDAARRVAALVEERVRPAVASDGGDMEFAGFRDGVLSLRLRGACAGCPSAPATLKHGIMNLMRFHAPEVTEVREAA